MEVPTPATAVAPTFSAAEHAEIEAAFAARPKRHETAEVARAHFAKTEAEGQYRLILEEVFASLPADEAAAMFVETEDPSERFYSPKPPTDRLLLARVGQKAADFFEALGPFHVAPITLADMGSHQGMTHMASNLENRDHEAATRENWRRWLDANDQAALPAMVDVAARGDGAGVYARNWLATRSETALPAIVHLAVAADIPEAFDRERFRHGRPVETLQWAARRYGVDTLKGVIDAEHRDRVESLARPCRQIDLATYRSKKWPSLIDANGEPLDDDAVRRIHKCDPTEAADLSADSKVAEANALAILDAFVADKAKPQLRWMIAAALALSPDATLRRLRGLMAGWSRSKNRNHRNHGKPVCAQLGRLGTREAVATLAMWSDSLSNTSHQHAARLALRHIAVDRGVNVEDLLEDALPDLGLEADGSLIIDFGPRSFDANFAHDGTPVIVDGKGKVRARLPKPGKKDDPEISAASIARFKDVKVDVKGVLGAEIKRLEYSLRTPRTWTAQAIRTRAEHPIFRIILPTLIWRSASGSTLRLGPSLEWLDDLDEIVSVIPDTDLRLAHPLDLDDDTMIRWRQIFADDELLPPFPQIDRESFPVDTSSGTVERCRDWQVPAGSLVGLLRSGWEGRWSHGPSLKGLKSPIEGGFAILDWMPFPTSEIAGAGPVYVGPLYLREHAWRDKILKGANPRSISELLRDLSGVRQA